MEPVTVIVGERLRVVDPPEGMRTTLVESLRYKNPAYSKAVKLDLWTKPPQFIVNCEATIDSAGDRVLDVPRGATNKVREAARVDGVELIWRDERLERPMQHPRTLEDAIQALRQARIEPTERQLESVAALVKRENAYLQAPTGMGKTVILALAVAAAGQRALVLVPDRGIFSQTVETFGRIFASVRELHGKRDVPAKRSCRKADVVVSTYDMLWGVLKRGGFWADEVRDGFGTIVTDEMHLVAAPTRICSVEQFPARYRWGCSATPTRHDGKEFLLFDAFGAPADHITTREAVEAGRILHAEIRIVASETRDLEYERVMLGGSPPQNAKVRKKLVDMADETLRKDEQRTRKIVDLMLGEYAEGHSVLTLCRRLDHCEALLDVLATQGHRCARIDSPTLSALNAVADMKATRRVRTRTLAKRIDAGDFSVAFLRGGGENREEFELVREAMRDGKIRLAVGSPKAFVGLDIPRLDRGIIATPVNSNVQLLEQMIGRFRRTHADKRDAVVYYVWDRHLFPGARKRIERTYGDLVRVA